MSKGCASGSGTSAHIHHLLLCCGAQRLHLFRGKRAERAETSSLRCLPNKSFSLFGKWCCKVFMNWYVLKLKIKELIWRTTQTRIIEVLKNLQITSFRWDFTPKTCCKLHTVVSLCWASGHGLRKEGQLSLQHCDDKAWSKLMKNMWRSFAG